MCSSIRRIAVSRSGTSFCVPITKMTSPAPNASGASWLPVFETTTIVPSSVTAWALLTYQSGPIPSLRIARSPSGVVRSIARVRVRTASNRPDSSSSVGDPDRLERRRGALADLGALGQQLEDRCALALVAVVDDVDGVALGAQCVGRPLDRLAGSRFPEWVRRRIADGGVDAGGEGRGGHLVGAPGFGSMADG